MHPSIGVLSSGRAYAFINGYAAEPMYGTIDELESVLANKHVVALKRPTRSVKTYHVQAKLKAPTWNCTSYEFQVLAASHAEALKKARGYVRWYLGHTRQDGGLLYSARVVHVARGDTNFE